MLAKALASATGAAPKTYIESVFSTFLYTGNGSTQTITNGIDLAGEGGLVWFKQRNSGSSHELVDTARGVGYGLDTRLTSAQTTSTDLTSFTSTGFSLGYNTGNANFNTGTFASWTFRKAAKFFDVVTYVGDGANRVISHTLGSVPGCIIVKRTDTTGDWQVYHRSLANTEYLVLNTTAAKATGTTRWNSTTPTSTEFSLGTDATVNANAGTYVAYLFAHDAGGFGDSGNESVIKCGSFTTDGSGNATVDLGWEPQWGLFKNSGGAANWMMFDVMRGAPVGGDGAYLQPNTSNAEFNIGSGVGYMCPTATGFQAKNLGGVYTLIYIAIRRGPMKTPTDATKVFQVKQANRSSLAGNIREDLAFWKRTDSSSYDNLQWGFSDRIRGISPWTTWTTTSTSTSPVLYSHSTAAEVTNASRAGQYPGTTGQGGGDPNAITVMMDDGSSASGAAYFLRRAPGFFDVVAATSANSSNQRFTHNLGVAPELIILKSRSASGNWFIYASSQGRSKYHYFDDQAINTLSNIWGTSDPTATDFGFASNAIYSTGTTLIAYLFATVSGVSKVGSYTGTGTTQQINCGFTAGARFVMIKRTDSTGDWYVWDTARGIVSGNDSYLLLNSTAAEVTNTDYIDPYSAGFEISSTAPAAINANGGSFIYLAVA